MIIGDDPQEYLNKLITEAQNGNEESREKIIRDNKLFVKKVVSKKVSGYEDISNRDEFSIGLMALNEAIDSFKPGHISFHSFAGSVIRNRLIDYYRSQKRHLDYSTPTDPEQNAEQYYNPEDQFDIKLEIQEFTAELGKYDISLRDLINETPKHSDSILLCLRIADIITSDAELCDHLKKYHTIPLKRVLQKTNLNKKTIGRHRKYIIAVCLVLLSDLDIMKGYVRAQLKGGGNNE